MLVRLSKGTYISGFGSEKACMEVRVFWSLLQKFSVIATIFLLSVNEIFMYIWVAWFLYMLLSWLCTNLITEWVNMCYGYWLIKVSAILKIYLSEWLRSGSETEHILKKNIHRSICRLVLRKAHIHAGSMKQSSVCFLR